jgi:hypothetical protein
MNYPGLRVAQSGLKIFSRVVAALTAAAPSADGF